MTLQVKKILGIISGIILVLLIGYTITMTTFYSNLKKEKNRIETNFFNSQFKLDSVITKNGELQYNVQTLTLKNDEFNKFAPSLVKELKDMGLKVKNLESVVKANIKYVYLPGDSIPFEVEKKSETKFIGTYSDKFLKLTERIELINNKTNIKIDSVSVVLTDSLIIAGETQYKSCWLFWKKPIGVKIIVKSQNPNFKIDQIQSYKLIK